MVAEGTRSTETTPADGIQLFASNPNDPRARRAIDGVRAVAWMALLLLASVLSVVGADLDQQVGDVLTSFPGFLRVTGSSRIGAQSHGPPRS